MGILLQADRLILVSTRMGQLVHTFINSRPDYCSRHVWLLIKFCIGYKILLLTGKALNSLTPEVKFVSCSEPTYCSLFSSAALILFTTVQYV